MKRLSFVLIITLCSCQVETDTQDTKASTSPIHRQEIKHLEIRSHKSGHVQWKLTAQELLSNDLEDSLLKNLNWTSQSNQLTISMKEAKQPEKQIFKSNGGLLSNASYQLQASHLELNLIQNKVTGQAAQLKHFQVEFDFKDFQLDLQTQQLNANQVHAIIKRSSP